MPSKTHKIVFLPVVFALLLAVAFVFARKVKTEDERFISYIVNAQEKDLKIYWKDENQQPFGSLKNLKEWLSQKSQTLEFAMNGGMYQPNHSPQGLFIENHQVIAPLDTSTGSGNFYLKPNGLFYLTTDNIPGVCTTADFQNDGKIKYATQSGPMLVINGKIHPVFKAGSTNLNIRNGVGILPDNRILFAMSRQAINFYDFAEYFLKAGCKNALYLDGFVSRTYLPEKNWVQTDGNFGVIIGVTTESR